jgi:formiminotetrahydrofolate cyclodeaminase
VIDSLADHSVAGLVTALAAKQPSPGGGAAAGAVAAIGMGLARMVLAYSIDKKSLADHAKANRDDDADLADLSHCALSLAQDDAEAFAALNALWKLPQDDPKRMARWDATVQAAIDAPMRTMHACLEALDRCDAMRHRTNSMLHSDLNGAVHLLIAAAHVAAENVRVNLPSVRDEGRRAEVETGLKDALEALA